MQNADSLYEEMKQTNHRMITMQKKNNKLTRDIFGQIPSKMFTNTQEKNLVRVGRHNKKIPDLIRELSQN